MNKKTYRGSLYLLVLVLVLIAVNQYVTVYFLNKAKSGQVASRCAALDSILAQMPLQTAPAFEKYRDAAPAWEAEKKEMALHLHPFDPNTVGKDEWLEMGLPERVFNGFEKYRAKGGRIRKPEDIKKLYNLKAEIAAQMVAYIRLDTTLFAKPKFATREKLPAFEKKVKVLFDLNQADTTQLMSVYGIGRGLANRIVRHRDGLGGFAQKAHVYDVFALDTAVVEELFTKAYLPDNPTIKKINLNTATEEDLARNPYIRKGLAKIIVKYRQQHGNYKQAEDLLQIKIVKPEVVEKVKHYLEF